MQYYLYKKCLKFKNVPKVGRGGATLIGTLSQIFSIFYFDASPKIVRGRHEIVSACQRLLKIIRECMRWSETVRVGQRFSEVLKDNQRLSEIVKSGQR